MLTNTAASYRRHLGDGLILRWSTTEDTEKIAELCGMVFRGKEDEPLNIHTANAVRRFMSGHHPYMGPSDYGIVEDTSREGSPVVACTCLWRHEWAYEDIPFGIGRPEFVATDPTYRNRGLIRALFDMVHARSEAEGHPVQAITGIAYFYRQFGYEYALDLEGRRATYLSLIPKLKEGETEPYTLREATIEDIPQIQQLYNRRRADSVVWMSVPDQDWHYLIEGWKAPSEKDKFPGVWMIVDASGAVKGFLMFAARRWGQDVRVHVLEIAAGISWQAVMPSVLRALQALAPQIPTRKPDMEPPTEITFLMGRTHPVYNALGSGLAPLYEPPYAWYVRVRDVPEFIKLIAPALEKRLENSVVAGYTGELKLDFYRGGLLMVFGQGRLATAESWKVPIYDSNAGAGFPPLVFLQLLFGHRSLDELRYAFPDVWTSNEAEVVLKALFPARPSYVPDFPM